MEIFKDVNFLFCLKQTLASRARHFADGGTWPMVLHRLAKRATISVAFSWHNMHIYSVVMVI